MKINHRNGTRLYRVRFEAFHLYRNETIETMGVWQYPIQFDFLPAYRLTKILRFSSVYSRNSSCQNNGIRQDILNSNGSLDFCSCSNGFYGKYCQFYDERCENYCSPSSICKANYRGILNGNVNPLCLCPVKMFGNTCSMKNIQCQINPCLNGGTCLVQYRFDDFNAYVCICTSFFEGNQCQVEKGTVNIDVIVSLNSTIERSKVVATTISFLDYQIPSLRLDVRYRQVHSILPSHLKLIYSETSNQFAPSIALMKIYSDNYRIEQPRYSLLYYYPNQKRINLTVNLTSENKCFSIETSDRGDFNHSRWNSSTALFFYHQICRTRENLSGMLTCFYDVYYFCICERDYTRAECFGYSQSNDQCSLCLSNGFCLKGELNNPRDFLCICPRCFSGQMCQHSNEFLGFTFDSLIIKDMIQNHRLFSIIYMFIVSIIFLIGLFNNICSYLTFIRPKPRKFGVGYYLLLVSLINPCSLLLLLFKVIHIVLGSDGSLYENPQSNLYTCKLVSYFLSLFTRITYWLTSFVTLERLCMVLLPTSTIFKNPRFALGLSGLTVLIISAMHVHELFYYTTTVDTSYTLANVTLCVTNYRQSSISTYNRFNIFIHYCIPFVIQVISITVTIMRTAVSRAKTRGNSRETFAMLFMKQFRTQKENYVTPMILVFSSLPQAILSFSYACTELKQSWQRYTLLITYFLSYLPQILGFLLYVLPSATFSKEFCLTQLGKRILCQQRRKIVRKQNLKINHLALKK